MPINQSLRRKLAKKSKEKEEKSALAKKNAALAKRREALAKRRRDEIKRHQKLMNLLERLKTGRKSSVAKPPGSLGRKSSVAKPPGLKNRSSSATKPSGLKNRSSVVNRRKPLSTKLSKFQKREIELRIAEAMRGDDDDGDANEMLQLLQEIKPMEEEKEEVGLSPGYVDKYIRFPIEKRPKSLKARGNLKIWGEKPPKLNINAKLRFHGGGKRRKKTRRYKKRTKRKTKKR